MYGLPLGLKTLLRGKNQQSIDINNNYKRSTLIWEKSSPLPTKKGA